MNASPRSGARFERARRRVHGGVGSPVRAFGTVGTPRFAARADGVLCAGAAG